MSVQLLFEFCRDDFVAEWGEGGFAPVVATSLRQVPRFATIPSYIAQPCSFDVDGDGQLSVASDGIAVIRTLLGCAM